MAHDLAPLPRRLSDFEGTWRLTREIDDRLSGQAGRFDGEAVFAPAPDGLAYAETGALQLGRARPVPATRRYHWRQAGNVIAIEFHDGRAFHTFALSDPAPSAQHACAPDDYRVTYDFSGWPVWRAVWEVSGPRKNYRMVSTYLRK